MLQNSFYAIWGTFYTLLKNTDLYLSYFILSYVFLGHNDSVEWGLTVHTCLSIIYKSDYRSSSNEYDNNADFVLNVQCLDKYYPTYFLHNKIGYLDDLLHFFYLGYLIGIHRCHIPQILFEASTHFSILSWKLKSRF